MRLSISCWKLDSAQVFSGGSAALDDDVGLDDGVVLDDGAGLDDAPGFDAGRKEKLGKVVSPEASAVAGVCCSSLPPPQALKTKDSDSSDKAVIRFKVNSCKQNEKRTHGGVV